ncbi:hypothetical protein [Mechercharimyces sp. CAU 1602]|uniref:hypothetical protein n=1 Tax=Mechercharimyces sp. CAU 1602 TaxID=2973933 RepID=UPI00216378D1|nr:hypothetical protein [Mechercharimyces sp. CAU 1602]MCS1352796.1 hypothetical protein [Mechercharimyces sp. CAU 1602]
MRSTVVSSIGTIFLLLVILLVFVGDYPITPWIGFVGVILIWYAVYLSVREKKEADRGDRLVRKKEIEEASSIYRLEQKLKEMTISDEEREFLQKRIEDMNNRRNEKSEEKLRKYLEENSNDKQ